MIENASGASLQGIPGVSGRFLGEGQQAVWADSTVSPVARIRRIPNARSKSDESRKCRRTLPTAPIALRSRIESMRALRAESHRDSGAPDEPDERPVRSHARSIRRKRRAGPTGLRRKHRLRAAPFFGLRAFSRGSFPSCSRSPPCFLRRLARQRFLNVCRSRPRRPNGISTRGRADDTLL